MTAGRTNVNQMSKEWATPKKFVDSVKSMFGDILLDPCSNQFSLVGAVNEYKLPIDGLKVSWNYKTIYVNPPYGRDYERGTSIYDWVEKCYLANLQYKSEVIALIPVATNTRHWKNFIFGKASGICFIKDSRLKFLVQGSDDNKGAPMACCLVYWGSRYDEFKNMFSVHGYVLQAR